MDWKDHVPEDQRGGLLCEYDDGSAIFHSSSSGGAAPEGSWGAVTLMRVEADGTTTFRDYVSTTDWRPMQDGPNPMCFSEALLALKRGQRVARSGWNGKGMFVVTMPRLQLPPFNTQDTSRKVNDRTAKWIGEDTPLDCQPYFAMWTADQKWQPGWVPSQQDMHADDWMIVS